MLEVDDVGLVERSVDFDFGEKLRWLQIQTIS